MHKRDVPDGRLVLDVAAAHVGRTKSDELAFMGLAFVPLNTQRSGGATAEGGDNILLRRKSSGQFSPRLAGHSRHLELDSVP